MRDEEMKRGKIPMSKMEVRSASLAYLDLYEAKHLIDIGAGTGSVGIEAARRHKGLQVTAIERVAEGVALIKENAEQFGLKNLQVIEAEAPCDLSGLTNATGEDKIAFDRVFIGGTGSHLRAILDWLKKDHLTDGAVVVINTIAIESLGDTLSALEAAGFTDLEGSMIQASRLDMLGRYHYFKPLNPCYIIKANWRKTCISL